ncbi:MULTISPECIES: hypothetical protein [unclassified Cyanobium]|uniref:hypothetical protein n=1 Tax=unclassified Cyanobium TaxID=2627006 RepID=UPI0020CCC75C|nr:MULTISPECIES: hypothetical protein [unclassified Cyanobium]MCP9860250.1 hypothetical protein [Cyanobium sp. Cruz-8H5]MCP9867097.1 hypothetical protein [Cyanobium sp. Cruz-8D1]
MDELRTRHERLLESHHTALREAAQRLLAEATWSLAATALLLASDDPDRSRVAAVGDLGRWIDHLGPDLDSFVRLRRQGMGTEEAYGQCRELEGDSFLLAWQALQGRHPLVSHDDLNHFAMLSQQGFSRTPRNLLVVVNWGDQVTAFLVSCDRVKRET